MLGSGSLGDDDHPQSLRWSYELLRDGFGIDPRRMHVTVFGGDGQIGPDVQSHQVWSIGPCGPDSEIFVWTEQDPLDDEVALSQAVLARWEADAYRRRRTGPPPSPDGSMTQTRRSPLAPPHCWPGSRPAKARYRRCWPFPPASRTHRRGPAPTWRWHICQSLSGWVDERLRHLLSPPDGLAAVTAAIALAYRSGDAIPDHRGTGRVFPRRQRELRTRLRIPFSGHRRNAGAPGPHSNPRDALRPRAASEIPGRP
jgi:hypothetical protein